MSSAVIQSQAELKMGQICLIECYTQLHKYIVMYLIIYKYVSMGLSYIGSLYCVCTYTNTYTGTHTQRYLDIEKYFN